MARLRLGLLGLLLLVALPAGAESEALERVYREAHPAVFRVEGEEGPRGTGFQIGQRPQVGFSFLRASTRISRSEDQ